MSELVNRGKSRNTARFRKIWSALEERLSLSSLAYPVPEHANTLPYLLGGITLFGFLILFATGVLLAQFYNPEPAQAHGSVIYLIEEVPFGDFLRSLHFWSANLVVVTVLLHLGRVFVTASYKRPREANWLAGVGLLALTLGFAFTGSVLKWDQEAVEALAHNREIGDALGLFGVWFTTEFSRSVPILTRLYLGHVTVLPAAFTALIALHLFLVRQLGISDEPSEDATSGPPQATDGRRQFTEHLRKLAGYGLVLLTIAGGLALASPAALGYQGVTGVEVTKPPWMFLPLYPLEDLMGTQGILVGSAVLFGLLSLVPFLDRSPWLSPRKRRWMIVAGAGILVLVVALGVFAWQSRPVPHLIQ